MRDPIVEEIRKLRDAYCAKYDYDLDAMFESIRARERGKGVTLSPKRLPKEEAEPAGAIAPGGR